MELDVSFARKQFPAFSEESLKGWAFFENAGGSYPCRQFLDRLSDFYRKNKVQPYYPYPASIKAGMLMDQAYQRMAEYLNVKPEEIHFGPSTTQNVYVLAQAMVPMWIGGDEIILSCQDHEANSGAWRRLEARGLKIIEWHVHPESGLLDVEDLKNLLSDRTRLVAFPHCSNVIGHINPVKEIVDLAHQQNVLVVVDGVGYAPHGFPDLQKLDVDVYLFSTYKTFGPHLGLMYVKEELIGKMQNQSHFFKEGVTRNMLTPAGPDHAQIGAVNGILDYFDQLYLHHFSELAEPNRRRHQLTRLFRAYETSLLNPLLEYLNTKDGVKIVGPASVENRLPIVSIIPQEKDIIEVYAHLTEHKLMLGKGHFYAVRPLMDMHIPISPGVIRMSFVHYTTREEVDQLIAGLDQVL